MPAVSIIVPCYNEEKTIALLLQAILNQTFPIEEMEVLISDGMSEDGTRREIEAFSTANPTLQVRVIDNPRRIIPAAINAALKASRGETIIRVDGHSMPDKNYVAYSLRDLQSGLGTNVGGIWQIKPGAPGLKAKAIALAAAHPLGVGDALYRYATQAAEVDTVPFGAFRRCLIEEIGGFDEGLLTNEDYEFNTRIRQHGGKIWLDPEIKSVYFARSTFQGLAKQYFRYGFWKWRMLRRYPGTLRWRQALPPVFTLSLLILMLAAPFWWLPALGLLIEVVLYMGALAAASIPLAAKNKDFRLAALIPAAIATMHVCWGVGFISSLLMSFFKKRK